MTLFAYDIETESWDRFILARALSDDGRVVRMETEADVVAWYESTTPDDRIIAHYGGGFDYIHLISITKHLRWSGMASGASLIACGADGHAQCRDTTRLFPGSLAVWTDRKAETGFTCECGKACGGFCQFKVNMSKRDRAILGEYCEADCRALLTTWLEDVAHLADDGFSVISPRGEVRLTIGGIAWNTAAPMAGIDPRKQIEFGDYDAGRRAYYGGRCEVGATSAPSGHRYDLHAAYPAALTQPVPVGKRRAVGAATAKRALSRMTHGSYDAIVDLPETDLPLLPHRYVGQTDGRLVADRLLWCTGRIEGSWTAIELSFALKHGARIVELTGADVWPSEAPLFEPYVRHAYARRADAKAIGDIRWAGVLKWYANALSGKLAQQPELTSIVVLGNGDDPGEGYVHHGPEDSPVWSRTSRRVSPCALTWCAAALTARTRVTLATRLLRHEGHWLYCDTDSTYLRRRDDIGVHPTDLGTWGYEGSMTEWVALAPKLYAYSDQTGKRCVKARGVPGADGETFEALRNGETVLRDTGVMGLRSSRGEFLRVTTQRRWLDRTTGRVGTRFATDTPRTRALHRTVDGRYV